MMNQDFRAPQAELIKMQPATLVEWRSRPYRRPEGFPAGFRVGNRVRYRAADVRAYIRAQAENSKT